MKKYRLLAKAEIDGTVRDVGYEFERPDDWDGPKAITRIAREAWRRAVAGQLTDNELYPYQAAKAAIVRARDEARRGK